MTSVSSSRVLNRAVSFLEKSKKKYDFQFLLRAHESATLDGCPYQGFILPLESLRVGCTAVAAGCLSSSSDSSKWGPESCSGPQTNQLLVPRLSRVSFGCCSPYSPVSPGYSFLPSEDRLCRQKIYWNSGKILNYFIYLSFI